MKHNYSIANTLLGLGLSLGAIFGGFTLLVAVASGKESEFGKYGTVSARRKGDTATVSVRAKGEWKVNTEYNSKLILDDVTLRNADAKFADEQDEKASAISWTTTTPATYGTVKVVFCSPTTCTAPISTNFNVIR